MREIIKAALVLAAVFGTGILVGREWVRYELRVAFAEAAAAFAPRMPKVKPKSLEPLGPEGVGCTIAFDIVDAGGGSNIRIDVSGDGDKHITSTVLVAPQQGQTVPAQLATRCSAIRGFRALPEN